MYIQDFIGDKGELLDAAMRHPALAPKRKPTFETALKCVVSEVERVCMTTVAKQYEEKLGDVYLGYTLMNGERDEADVSALGDWDSGLDDEVEKLLGEVVEFLSQDWLAQKTIDTRLHEEGEIVKLATSVGKEIFKQLTFGKEPGQFLANAGILKSDVEAFFETHMQPKTPEQEKATMAEQEQTVAGIAATIAATIGADFNQMEVYEDIEMLFDEDAILSGAAAARLGVTEGGIEILQMAALDSLDAEALFALVSNAPAEEAPKKAPAVKPTTATGTARKKKEDKSVSVENAISPDVLQAYKTHGGTPDTEFAAKLGVSRGTYNNYLSGKTAFTPDDSQRETLRNQIVENINGLLGALGLIDNFEYEAFQ